MSVGKKMRVVAWCAVCAALILGSAGCTSMSTTSDTTGSGSDTTAEDSQTTAPDTVAPTVTTEDPRESLDSRVEDWIELLAMVGDSDEDMTEEIADFLWPQEEALSKAAEYQRGRRAEPDPENPIVDSDTRGVVRVSLAEDGDSAAVLLGVDLVDRDGSETKGLQLLTWTRQDGIWYRTVGFEPLPAASDGIRPIDSGILVDDVSWSVESVSELRRLVASDEPETGRAYLIVRVQVTNHRPTGSPLVMPADYEVVLYDEDSRQFAASKAFDARFPTFALDKQDELNFDISKPLVYCFEVPRGLDLSALRFEIQPSSE